MTFHRNAASLTVMLSLAIGFGLFNRFDSMDFITVIIPEAADIASEKSPEFED